jgi:methylmalonyl-CoA/ethylmalonyl-CoA epimerase
LPVKIRGVHHIGVLVRDARATATALRRALGLRVTSWENYGPGVLRIGFIPTRGALLELIEPLTADGFNADWLRERGEGIQHVALRVDDIEAAMQTLRARGVAFQDTEPRAGAANTRIAFLAREVMGDLMIELTQPMRRARRRARRARTVGGPRTVGGRRTAGRRSGTRRGGGTR